MPSKDFVSDAAEGATKGFLEWSSEKIVDLVKKLKDRNLAFIQEKKTIDIVKEQYNSGEGKFYKSYIKDKELLFLVRMGLTLRKLEKDRERQQNLRDKVFKRYNAHGLHIAEFVQNGILNRYVGLIIDELPSIEKLEEEIEEILNNIEKHVLFVQSFMKVSDVVKKATTIVDSHSPQIFIISGMGFVSNTVRESEGKIKEVLKEYNFEKISRKDKETLFFKKVLS